MVLINGAITTRLLFLAAALLLLLSPALCQPAADAINDDKCAACPDAAARDGVVPVCAQQPGVDISMTLSHRCWAECQGMTVLAESSCEDLLNAQLAAADDGVSAAAATKPFQRQRKVKPRAFHRPTTSQPCQPSAAELRRSAAEGRVFVGCAKASKRTSPRLPDATARDEPSASQLIAGAQPGDHVVLTATHINIKTRHMFVQAQKMSLEQLQSAMAAPVALSSLPGSHGPSPAAWDKHQLKPASYSTVEDGSGSSVSAAAAVEGEDGTGDGEEQQAAAGEPEVLQTQEAIAQTLVVGDEPMASLGAAAASGGRKLLQMIDNRQRVADTTAAPYKSLVQLKYRAKAGSYGCSGSLLSPDDVITAAHCVVDSVTGEIYTNYVIVPGANDGAQPYGSFTAATVAYWQVWVGGAYNSQPLVAAGSVYVDMGLLDLSSPVTWWAGAGYQCSGPREVQLRACGYPGDKGFAQQWCSDGVSAPIDFCDATTDFVTSVDAYTAPGMSGGPVFDRATGKIVAIVSGARTSIVDNKPRITMFSPLDNTHWRLLVDPTQLNTLWSRSNGFAPPGSNTKVKTAQDGKCLTMTSTAAGARVAMATCSGAAGQTWHRPAVVMTGDQAPDLRLAVGASGMCLDVYGARTSNGTPVITWPCHSGDNQKFVYDREGRLRPLHAPHMCVDISGASRAEGAALIIWPCHDNANQKWLAAA